MPSCNVLRPGINTKYTVVLRETGIERTLLSMPAITNKWALLDDGLTHLGIPLQDADFPVFLMKTMAEGDPVVQRPQLGCEAMVDQVLIEMGMQEYALAIKGRRSYSNGLKIRLLRAGEGGLENAPQPC